jgi:NAD(P)H-quinone oxidoreductase subunit 5
MNQPFSMQNHSPAIWLCAQFVLALGGVVALLMAALSYLAQHQPIVMFGFYLGVSSWVLISLVLFLGAVITRFSASYLLGESGAKPFFKWLMLVIAAVLLLVSADHLGLVLLAWCLVNLGMDRLLRFFGNRQPALIAAHKRKMFSRLAELLMAASVLLLMFGGHPLALSELNRLPTLDGFVAAALGLIVVAVLIQSAQLPVHGWLIQVMEAPTPVSALLHAGVINIGAWVLIRLSDLLMLAAWAQAALITVGGLSAVLAGLVWLTRISIKVRLAWSTCAQIGFMLLTLGLGYESFALLHMVGHSLYKANAFLRAGSVVQKAQVNRLFGGPVKHPKPSVFTVLLAPFIVASVLFGLLALVNSLGLEASLLWGWIVILALAWAPLLWAVGQGRFAALQGIFYVAALAVVYLGWGLWLADGQAVQNSYLMALASGLMLVLYIGQALIVLVPQKGWMLPLYGELFGGFFLDEKITVALWRLWPLKQARATSIEG